MRNFIEATHEKRKAPMFAEQIKYIQRIQLNRAAFLPKKNTTVSFKIYICSANIIYHKIEFLSIGKRNFEFYKVSFQ